MVEISLCEVVWVVNVSYNVLYYYFFDWFGLFKVIVECSMVDFFM